MKMNLNRRNIAIGVTVLAVLAALVISIVYATRSKSPSEPFQAEIEQDAADVELTGPIGSNEIIGMVYPPRLGPLHSNFKIPSNGVVDQCKSPFAIIYKNGVVFNRCLPAGR